MTAVLCVVTAFSDAPICWPRVRALEHKGGSGLWICAELVRAIRTESATALQHWFGVSSRAVWQWRRSFSVGGHATTKGSRRAIKAAAKKGAKVQQAKVWTVAERRAKSASSKLLGLRPTGRWTGRGWTPEQLALLGTARDEEVAKALKRTKSAVTSQRVNRRIPAYSGGTGGVRYWTAGEIALLGTAPNTEIAHQIGRSLKAVQQKRAAVDKN